MPSNIGPIDFDASVAIPTKPFPVLMVISVNVLSSVMSFSQITDNLSPLTDNSAPYTFTKIQKQVCLRHRATGYNLKLV